MHGFTFFGCSLESFDGRLLGCSFWCAPWLWLAAVSVSSALWVGFGLRGCHLRFLSALLFGGFGLFGIRLAGLGFVGFFASRDRSRTGQLRQYGGICRVRLSVRDPVEVGLMPRIGVPRGIKRRVHPAWGREALVTLCLAQVGRFAA